jgi:hypothetical protein
MRPITVVNLMARHMRDLAGLPDDEIIRQIYTSKTYKLIEKEENGFWSESPNYLAELVIAETQGKQLNFEI